MKKITPRVARIAAIRAQIQPLKSEIERLEALEENEQAAPFLGAHFKYRGRASDGAYWWTYMRILSNDGMRFTALSFEAQPGGWNIVKTDGLYLLPNPDERGLQRITRAEFARAWKRYQQQMNRLVLGKPKQR